VCRARRRREEHGVGRILGEKGFGEVGADLVGGVTDARAHGGDHVGTVRPQALHGTDGRVEHAAQRAAPAGMGGADHTGLGIGEQDRRAVGGENAERHPRPRRHHAIHPGAILRRPGSVHHPDVAAVNLMAAEQGLGAGAERGGGAGAVLAHALRRVRRAGPAIERGEQPLADAAAPGKEAVTHARRRRESVVGEDAEARRGGGFIHGVRGGVRGAWCGARRRVAVVVPGRRAPAP